MRLKQFFENVNWKNFFQFSDIFMDKRVAEILNGTEGMSSEQINDKIRNKIINQKFGGERQKNN
jgi:hypothetical protein